MRNWILGLLLAVTSITLILTMAWVTVVSRRIEQSNVDIQRDMNLQAVARQALWWLDSAAMPLLVQKGTASSASEDSVEAVRRWPFMLIHQTFHWQGQTPGLGDEQSKQLAVMIAGARFPEEPAPAEQQLVVLNVEDLKGTPTVPSRDRMEGQRLVSEMQQQQLNIIEYNTRSQSIPNSQRMISDQRDASLMQSLVIDGQLVLLHVASIRGAGEDRVIQGSLLDWPELRRRLLHEIRDLLPDADLELKMPDTSSFKGEEHRMAVLPVVLKPGRGPDLVLPESSLRGALPMAWASLLLAMIALGLLLWGTLRLSARRSAFVQAVTHEMRTPLTTFRLYADLLASGREISADRTNLYISTLQREALRLSQMVENVLLHAKLERRNLRPAHQICELASLVDRAWDRLDCRAKQAGLELRKTDELTEGISVQADESVVEQILLNLVDNACKYGAQGEDRSIVIRLSAEGSHGVICIEDHGPGVSVADARWLFKPFARLGPGHGSQSADATPGVGLGLSISRRLARAMGGDVVHQPASQGAVFAIRLRRLRDAR